MKNFRQMDQDIRRKGIDSVFYSADRLLGNIDLSGKICLSEPFFITQFSDPVIQSVSHPLVFYIFLHLFYLIYPDMISKCNVSLHSYSGYKLFFFKIGARIKKTAFTYKRYYGKCTMKSILGENIKRLRKQRGINQAVLASVLNIGRQTISAYECGITLPDIFVLIQIADYFEVTLDELAGREALVIEGEEE